MKKTKSQHLVSWVILIMLISITLSSCSFIDQFTDKGKIKITVKSYLSDIQSGVFTYDKLASKYASDTAFSELEYLADEAEVIMKSGMKKITFEIGDITADKSNKTGTCGVTISTVDVQKVREGFGENMPNYDEMLAAVGAEGSVMSEHMITLSVIYDSAAKMWKVSDSSPLVDIIAKPYTEMIFVPDPIESINDIFFAVKVSDCPELDKFSESRIWSLPDDEAEKTMAKAMNNMTVFEIVGDPVITDNLAEVTIKVTLPDFEVMMDEFVEDVEYWAGYAKPVILGVIDDKEDPTLSQQLYQMTLTEILGRIEDTSTKSLTTETIMQLRFDDELDIWVITDWTYTPFADYFGADDPVLSDEMIDKSCIRALEILLADGDISKSEYNQYSSGYE